MTPGGSWAACTMLGVNQRPILSRFDIIIPGAGDCVNASLPKVAKS